MAESTENTGRSLYSAEQRADADREADGTATPATDVDDSKVRDAPPVQDDRDPNVDEDGSVHAPGEDVDENTTWIVDVDGTRMTTREFNRRHNGGE
jgi:hypothetical protein